MKRPEERDRREHARFPQALEVCARGLPPVQASYSAPKEVRGRIQNVSQGGVCIMSPHPLAVSTFVFCEIAVPDIPVSIPTLMQVRWTAKRGRDGQHYINGLRFVAA